MNTEKEEKKPMKTEKTKIAIKRKNRLGLVLKI